MLPKKILTKPIDTLFCFVTLPLKPATNEHKNLGFICRGKWQFTLFLIFGRPIWV